VPIRQSRSEAIEPFEAGSQRIEFSHPTDKNQRIYAAAELAALAILFAASLWGQIQVGVVGWLIVAAWLFSLIMPISALLRHHN